MSAPSQPETPSRRCALAARLAPLLLLLGSTILTAPAFARPEESPDAATTESSPESTTEAPGTEPEEEAGEYSESMLVVAERADRRSTGATGLDLEILETP